jgi:hypothetical protein
MKPNVGRDEFKNEMHMIYIYIISLFYMSPLEFILILHYDLYFASSYTFAWINLA